MEGMGEGLRLSGHKCKVAEVGGWMADNQVRTGDVGGCCNAKEVSKMNKSPGRVQLRSSGCKWRIVC